MEWETKAKDKNQMATFEANILTWTRQMDELQQKIGAAKMEKAEIDNSILSSAENKLVEEDITGIEHSKNVHTLENEVNKLKNKDVMKDKRDRFSRIHFENMKTDLMS